MRVRETEKIEMSDAIAEAFREDVLNMAAVE